MRGFIAFLSDETGSQSIEFMLWIPLIVSLLVMVTDASLLYLNHAQMWTVARDTARRMSTGQLNEADAKAYALAELGPYGYVYDVEPIASDQFMTVWIKVNVADVSPFGYFIGSVLGKNMIARVAMRTDPNVTVVASANPPGKTPPGQSK